jgi:hypothetical protein
MKYTAGYKYQLHDDYECQTCIKPPDDIGTQFINLKKDGTLRVLRGYAWDGPSGPTIDTKSFMRGSLIHDVLYQLMRIGLLPHKKRIHADDELKKACLEDGMNRIRAWLVYRGVRKFSGFAIEHKKEVFSAPKETE